MRSKFSTLLLQFRKNKTGPHEVKSIYNKYEEWGGDYSNFAVVNVADFNIDVQKEIIPLIDKFDSVILGGSGEFGFYHLESSKESKEYKAMIKILSRSKKIIEYLLKTEKPTLGICFGIQLLGWYLGGDVVTDGDKYEEFGFVEIKLVKQKRDDPLFHDINTFYSAVGHHSSVINFPVDKGIIHLAYNDKIKNHAIKYKNFYALQFHPEITYKEYFERKELYKKGGFLKVNKNLLWYKDRINAKIILFNFWDWSRSLS